MRIVLPLIAISASLALPALAEDNPPPPPISEAAPPDAAAPDAAPPDAAAPDLAGRPVCRGAPGAQWIAGDAGASDASAATDPLRAEVPVPAGGAAVLAFRVTADQQALRLEATSDGDPMLRLTTSDGDQIAEADDTDWSLDSLMESTLGPGTYCLSFASVDGLAMAGTVQVARPDQPALLDETASRSAGDIAACTAETEAEPLAEGSLAAAIGDGLHRDLDGNLVSYLRFSLDAATPLTLRAASQQLDPHVRLFDSKGDLVAENDDADSTDSRIDFPNGLPEGEYCLGVAALSPAEGQIRLSVDKLDRDSYLRAAYRRGEIAPPLDGSVAVEAVDPADNQQVLVLHDGSAKWVSVKLAHETALIVDAFALLAGGDPRLALFGETGAPVAENDDVEGSTNARLGPVLLAPGSYRIALTDLDRGGAESAPVRPIMLNFRRFEAVK